MKIFLLGVCFLYSVNFISAQNVGIGVANPEVNLSILKGVQVDAESGNDGTRNNSLQFGVPTTGEYILSKRTAGGNQYGIDFHTGHFSRLAISNGGFIGIGTSTPSARLQIYQAGNYAQFEATYTHALELLDSSTSNRHVLYMGANAANGLSYIQAASVSGSWDLLLQGRGGNVMIGKAGSANLLIHGDLVVDNYGFNNRSLGFGLRFGTTTSGEGIASNRNAGVNQYGLDFYTGGNVRMSIGLDGVVNVDNKPVLTVAGTGKQVVLSTEANLSSASLSPGTQVSATYDFLLNSISGAWPAGFIPVSGECSKIAVSTELINTSAGHYSIKVYATNISNSAVGFSGKWKLMVMGSY